MFIECTHAYLHSNPTPRVSSFCFLRCGCGLYSVSLVSTLWAWFRGRGCDVRPEAAARHLGRSKFTKGNYCSPFQRSASTWIVRKCLLLICCNLLGFSRQINMIVRKCFVLFRCQLRKGKSVGMALKDFYMDSYNTALKPSWNLLGIEPGNQEGPGC